MPPLSELCTRANSSLGNSPSRPGRHATINEGSLATPLFWDAWLVTRRSARLFHLVSRGTTGIDRLCYRRGAVPTISLNPAGLYADTDALHDSVRWGSLH